jgi:cytochrome P450
MTMADAGNARAPEPRATAALWEERVMRGAHPFTYRALKASRRPVRRVRGLGVLVTDATLLRSVLLDAQGFSKNGPGASSELWTPILGPSILINMDGAEHGALRRQLAPLFTPAWVDTLCANSLGPDLARLTERLAAGERVDIVAEVRRFASIIIRQLVGLDGVTIDDELFARISAITGFVRLTRPRLTQRQVATARVVLDELDVAARAAYAGDDSTVPGRMRALGLSEKDALGAVGAFVLTGTETLVSYIPRLVALLADSGWAEHLRDRPEFIEPAIAEGLRVTTPSPVMLRSVTRDGAVGGVAVHRGDRMILATFAANRGLGPFDPTGTGAASLKQLWFGAGSHFCLGAPLAMAQIRLVVDCLLAAPKPIRIEHRAVARRVLIPGYRSLVVSGG